MTPVQIKVNRDNSLYVKWNDDSESEIQLSHLRRYCPCAICASLEENHDHDSIKVYNEAQLKIDEIKVVGNYAVAIIWGDNHNTGIYDFSYLKKISEI